MNKKAQMKQIGVLIMVFVAVIVGVALMISSAGTVGTSTTTITLTNSTITSPANGAATDLTGQDLLSTPVVHNASTGAIIPTTNYTLSERVSPTTGLKTVYFQTDDASIASQSLNVSYTYGPDGYINDSAGRSIAGLITVFFALAIGVIGLIAINKDQLLDMIGR